MLLASASWGSAGFAAEDLSKGLIEEHEAVNYDHCMSLKQLDEVLQVAAWKNPAAAQDTGATMERAVVLTSCNLKCLKSLFEPFMLGVERAKGGDFSEHVVVVAYGVAAYLYCDAMRHVYKHHCVLDRMCAPPHVPPEFSGHAPSPASEPVPGGQPKDPIETVIYWLGMSNRIHWASKVVEAGVSVLWSDLDVHWFANPFKFLQKHTPDADVVFETGYFFEADQHSFRGHVCKKGGAPGSCIPSDDWTEDQPLPACCMSPSLNGGIWLVNPTASGTRFIRAWHAIMFERAIVKLGVFGKGQLEYDFVYAYPALECDPMPVYAWDNTTRRYDPVDSITCDGVPELVMYRLSTFVAASWCASACGARNVSEFGNNQIGGNGFDFYYVSSSGERSQQPQDDTVSKVCAMPKKFAERRLAFHICCNTVMSSKAQDMWLWLNSTFDEDLYNHLLVSKGRGVYPDW
mmetsp:Transcript_2710/g.7340  ORF Transcript_2710/g.7340 Transcript_2710/m.7340 type:complete len:460 (-) Transcript_2710:870-2249(-)